MSRSEQLKKGILRTAALLLCLTLLSMCATGKMYARYSTGVSYSDGARVAQFHVTEAGDLTQTITIAGMKPGDTETFDVEVTSDSEVAIYYSIAVNNVYKNLPLTFQMKNSEGNVIDKGTIGANENTAKKYTLVVTWPSENNSPEYAGKTDLLAITLTAAQVD